jgi:hypothetical protein
MRRILEDYTTEDPLQEVVISIKRKLSTHIYGSNTIVGGVNDELDRYCAIKPVGEINDPCQWWKLNGHQFPTISKLAKDVLPVPGTEVPSESAFSSARQTLTYTRSLLSPETLEALMITKYFLQKDIADMRLLAKYDDETVMALLEELGVLELDQLIALENE